MWDETSFAPSSEDAPTDHGLRRHDVTGAPTDFETGGSPGLQRGPGCELRTHADQSARGVTEVMKRANELKRPWTILGVSVDDTGQIVSILL